MIRIASLAVLALLATPALAQQAPTAKAERPLISVGYGSDFGIFVETPLAGSSPVIEAWNWMIKKEPTQMPGATYDMIASRELIDCAAWTRKQLYSDGFLGERYLGRDPAQVGPDPITPGAGEAFAKILCGKVDISKDAPIADIAAARQLTQDHFFKPISSQ